MVVRRVRAFGFGSCLLPPPPRKEALPVKPGVCLPYLEKIRALQAGTLLQAMNTLAWNTPIGLFVQPGGLL